MKSAVQKNFPDTRQHLQAQVRSTLSVNIGFVAEDQRRGQFPEEQGGGRRLRHHQRVLPDLILIPLPGENTESWEMNEQDSSTYSLQGIKTEINRGTVLGVRGVVQGFFLLFLACYQGSKIKLHGMADSATTKDKGFMQQRFIRFPKKMITQPRVHIIAHLLCAVWYSLNQKVSVEICKR